MDSFLQDVRYACRALMRQPGFTAIAVLSLGLGIGAVTTIYLWADRWVFRPLPMVPGVDRLVQLQTQAPGGDTWSLSYPTSRDWRARNRVFEGLAVYDMAQVGLRVDGGGTERAWALEASEEFFDVLRVRPVLGRGFQPGEEAQAAQVVVLGHRFWELRFRADSAVIGRVLALNGHDFTVVGVLPPAFGGAYVGLTADFYVPITARTVLDGSRPWERRGWQFMDGIARLKPGVTVEAARADLARVGRELDVIHPDDANTAVVRLVREFGASAILLPVMFALLGITVLVLLIACANVANLLLARATARRKELGVRLAIGAPRGRIIGQLLTESLVLAAAGGAVGIYLAHLGANAVRFFIPPAPIPIVFDATVSPRVLLTALTVTLATVAVFGLAPALRASRLDLVPVLKDLPGGGGRGRAQGALVVGQVALSLVSLVSAGLFLRGLARAQQVDLGFRDPGSMLLVSTSLQMAGVPDSTRPAVMDRLLAELRVLPGVTSATAATSVPLGFGGNSSSSVVVDGYVRRRDEDTSIQYTHVLPDYFLTMGIPIVRGRPPTADDRGGQPAVAVVNERFAARFWPGREAVGRQFRQSGTTYTVVGVARNGKYRQLTESPRSMVYRALLQEPQQELTVQLRSSVAPGALVPEARRAFERAEAALPFLDPRSMSEQIMPATIGQRLGSRMLALFGGVALLLAAIGLYGVVSYGVTQRRREFGVRVALGAESGGVARLVLRQGLRLTAVGLAVGTVLALGTGYLLRGQLFGLSPADPVTFGALILLLLAVAVLASVLPARRAARVDPLVALRSE